MSETKTKPCRLCKTKINSTASVCPQCQHGQGWYGAPKTKTLIEMFGVIVAIGSALFAAYQANNANVSKDEVERLTRNQQEILSYKDIGIAMNKGEADQQCENFYPDENSLAITVSRLHFGTTGSDMCSENIDRTSVKKQCIGVLGVFVRADNSKGVYPERNKQCSEELSFAWPWGLSLIHI